MTNKRYLLVAVFAALLVGAGFGLYFSDHTQVEGTWVKRSAWSPTVYLEVGPKKVKYYWIDHTCSTGGFFVDTLSSDEVIFGDYRAKSMSGGKLVVTKGRRVTSYTRSSRNASDLCREINIRKKSLGRWHQKRWTSIHPDIISTE